MNYKILFIISKYSNTSLNRIEDIFQSFHYYSTIFYRYKDVTAVTAHTVVPTVACS